MAHADHDWVRMISSRIRSVGVRLNREPAIMMDVKGPEIRTGYLHNEVELKKDDLLDIVFVAQPDPPQYEGIWQIEVNYDKLADHIKSGDTVLIDNGLIPLLVIESSAKRIRCKVLQNSILKSRRHVNLPGIETGLPSLTEKDKRDSKVGIECKHDFFALSFTRDADAIDLFRRFLQDNGSDAHIIAKLEDQKGVSNIDEIITASDAIMIARGDLGVELPVEKIPLIQKELIRKCIHRAKPVIVATQMMESMIDRVKPNRSEITDVANAVIEGADAVMLSGETATGQFPVLVIETMRKIITEVEENGYKYNRSEDLKPQPHSPSFLSDAVCYNASKLSEDSNAHALVGMTQSGYTAFMLSSFRPQSPLFIFTKQKSLVNQLSLSWGVKAFYYDKEESLDEIIKDQIQVLKAQGFVNTGDVVVNTGSTPIQLHLPTNMIKINKVD